MSHPIAGGGLEPRQGAIAQKALADLASAIQCLLSAMDSTVLGKFLADWPPANVVVLDAPRDGLPVLRWLPGIACGPKFDQVFRYLKACAPYLIWRQTYTVDDFGPDFLNRYGWAELVGQQGPIRSNSLACGLLLLAPQTEYPLHNHMAEEIYIPIAGTGKWYRDDEGWSLKTPGALIHHPSWTGHAICTFGEPLLTLYLWRDGDLTQKSRIL